MHNLENYITIDEEILGGTPVFKGTRVPVESMFWHLMDNVPLREFLDDFDSVTESQAKAVLEIALKFITTPQTT